MLQRLVKLAVLTFIMLAPTLVFAQASITGVVRDTSGGVLPGVTVEAASPALIEKVRSVVSDGTGQYRIENLRPGAYTVTFTLPGFATVRREGIELTGSFTATVNADLRVGGLEETLTVTGEAPVVDVQSTTRQRVITQEILDSIPTDRGALAVGVLIPGVNFNRQNVGGVEAQWGRLSGSLSVSGGGSAGTTLNGILMNTLASGAATTTVRMNPAATQEVTIDTAAVSAELDGGGVRVNYVPKDGGNAFTSTLIGSFSNKSLQSSNFTQDLKDRGLGTPNALDRMWDVNPGFGGPIQQDRLWFYGGARYNWASQYVAGLFYNRNENNPNAWTYDPDPSRPVINNARNPDLQGRLTWQATPKNKIGILAYHTSFCFCPLADAVSSVEAGSSAEYPFLRYLQADWTSPFTSRLLFEVGTVYYTAESNQLSWPHDRVTTRPQHTAPQFNPVMIGVQEQSTGLNYRGPGAQRILPQHFMAARATVSYITGAHVIKIGMNERIGSLTFYGFDHQPLSYRFNNGVPNQITQRAQPFTRRANMDHDLGIFVQNKWTVERLTLSYGARYDYKANSFPEQHVGPALLAPGRDITFPAQKNIAYHDLSPKAGASYDVFGTGKTAVKATLNRYVAVVGIDSTFGGDANPVNNLITSTTRSWTDANRDFVPNCDLTSPLANGECGAMANAAFGSTRLGATYDPDLLRGWFTNRYNWEFSAGVQQELSPRVSADINYYRRWHGNFPTTDNLAVSPADHDPFSITAPLDSRLPGGGGYVISGLYDLKPEKFGVPTQNFVTRADNYGKRVEYWQGGDVSINARPSPGLFLQGGLSTGRTVTDECEIRAKLDNPSLLYCRVVTPFLTELKFLGSYTIPRIDVQFSGTLQSRPGPEILANYNATNAEVAPSLGRNLAGGARNVTVNLVAPGTMYGDRMNQLDLRVAKILRFGRTSTRINLDFYNALNTDAVLTQNNNFGAWQRPTLILPARFAKLGVQFDF
jgi:hypothetical protein